MCMYWALIICQPLHSLCWWACCICHVFGFSPVSAFGNTHIFLISLLFCSSWKVSPVSNSVGNIPESLRLQPDLLVFLGTLSPKRSPSPMVLNISVKQSPAPWHLQNSKSLVQFLSLSVRLTSPTEISKWYLKLNLCKTNSFTSSKYVSSLAVPAQYVAHCSKQKCYTVLDFSSLSSAQTGILWLLPLPTSISTLGSLAQLLTPPSEWLK